MLVLINLVATSKAELECSAMDTTKPASGAKFKAEPEGYIYQRATTSTKPKREETSTVGPEGAETFSNKQEDGVMLFA